MISKDKWPASGRRLDSVGAYRAQLARRKWDICPKSEDLHAHLSQRICVFDITGTLLTCCLRDARYYEIDTNIRRNPGVLRLERMEMSSAVIFGSACFALTAVVVM